MTAITVTTANLPDTRAAMRKILGVRAGHLTEAIARTLGFRNHGALLAHLRDPDGEGRVTAFLEPGSLGRHLGRFGYEIGEPKLREACATGAKAATFSEAARKWSPGSDAHLLVKARCQLAMGLPGLLPAACIETRMSGSGVRPSSDGRVFAYPPGWLPSSTARELVHAVAAAAMHKELGHHGRRNGRDPHFWSVACGLVVHAALDRISWLAVPGRTTREIGDGITAEEAYTKIGSTGAACRQPLMDILDGDAVPGAFTTAAEASRWLSSAIPATSSPDGPMDVRASGILSGSVPLGRIDLPPRETYGLVVALCRELGARAPTVTGATRPDAAGTQEWDETVGRFFAFILGGLPPEFAVMAVKMAIGRKGAGFGIPIGAGSPGFKAYAELYRELIV